MLCSHDTYIEYKKVLKGQISDALLDDWILARRHHKIGRDQSKKRTNTSHKKIKAKLRSGKPLPRRDVNQQKKLLTKESNKMERALRELAKIGIAEVNCPGFEKLQQRRDSLDEPEPDYAAIFDDNFPLVLEQTRDELDHVCAVVAYNDPERAEQLPNIGGDDK